MSAEIFEVDKRSRRSQNVRKGLFFFDPFQRLEIEREQNKGSETTIVGADGQKPFQKTCNIIFARSGRILEERRQGNILADNLTVVNMNKNSINPSVKFPNKKYKFEDVAFYSRDNDGGRFD